MVPTPSPARHRTALVHWSNVPTPSPARQPSPCLPLLAGLSALQGWSIGPQPSSSSTSLPMPCTTRPHCGVGPLVQPTQLQHNISVKALNGFSRVGPLVPAPAQHLCQGLERLQQGRSIGSLPSSSTTSLSRPWTASALQGRSMSCGTCQGLEWLRYCRVGPSVPNPVPTRYRKASAVGPLVNQPSSSSTLNGARRVGPLVQPTHPFSSSPTLAVLTIGCGAFSTAGSVHRSPALLQHNTSVEVLNGFSTVSLLVQPTHSSSTTSLSRP